MSSIETEHPNPTEGSWFLTRIRIYEDYVMVQFGGALEKGLPVIKQILDENIPTLNLPEQYNATLNNSSYLVLSNFSGFTQKIGWLIIGVLIGQGGWFFHEYRNEAGCNNELIDLVRMDPI
ncbi:MAG: hypothetical protein VB013_00040 [Anaerolineaceae bacterium]|nr:hypothetical protein [Anaerolineaceae bacterium]